MWSEVIDGLRRARVDRMAMHMLGRRLMRIVEVRGGLDAQRMFAAHAASNRRVHEWERLRRS